MLDFFSTCSWLRAYWAKKLVGYHFSLLARKLGYGANPREKEHQPRPVEVAHLDDMMRDLCSWNRRTIIKSNQPVPEIPLLLPNFSPSLNPNISMKTWDVSIFSLLVLVCRGSPTLPPNWAIILVGVVVENPWVVEDGQYFLGKALQLQMSSAIQHCYCLRCYRTRGILRKTLSACVVFLLYDATMYFVCHPIRIINLCSSKTYSPDGLVTVQ